MNLSDRFPQALAYAFELHRYQTRKDTSIPYMAHLLGVTALILEDGGDEDQAIAALLHDAVEDQGGLATLEEIRRRFGDHVAEIVMGCTDSVTTPKPPWLARKRSYLEHLPAAPPAVVRVSLADKLHNARRILEVLRSEGDGVWARFKGGKDGTLWYYRALVETFRPLTTSPMLAELERVVTEIETLA